MVARHITIAAFSDLTHDQRLQRIADALAQNGFEVTLVGRLFPHSIDLNSQPYRQQRLSFRFAGGKLAYLEFNIRLIFALWRLNPHAICAVDLDTLPACWLVAKVLGRPLFHDAHEYMEEVPEVYQRPATRLMWALVARLFLPGVHKAYTVSQSLVNEFAWRYGKAFALVRNIPGRTLPADSGASPYGSGYWVFLGAVNKGRGIEEFLEILPYTNRKLVIVGTGDRLDAIRQLVMHKALEHMVVFAGKLRPEEVLPILHHAWAGINLLTDEGLSYRYSLANKFFDYVHAGIPQLCISFPEYIGLNHQFEVAILTSLHPQALLAATEVISNPLKREILLKNCQKAQTVWNWSEEQKSLLAIYNGLL